MMPVFNTKKYCHVRLSYPGLRFVSLHPIKDLAKYCMLENSKMMGDALASQDCRYCRYPRQFAYLWKAELARLSTSITDSRRIGRSPGVAFATSTLYNT